MKNKRYSRGEELSNTLSHGAGTLLGITAGYFLLEKALANPHPYWATGCVLAYLVGMLASYISSTWYHGSRPGKRKELLRKFEILEDLVLNYYRHVPKHTFSGARKKIP